ncbi:hypothetical protein CIPAW_16G061700 [Carya illinoinensis]|uniref:Uncharacterized protein n=1 Tax=Carya illinoinensis TaxID=32201 RepID=A0A8T1N7C9_CARIL|nr:hypothetical protein CIPAW_16G061700 [Carya illinoinensis]
MVVYGGGVGYCAAVAVLNVWLRRGLFYGGYCNSVGQITVAGWMDKLRWGLGCKIYREEEREFGCRAVGQRRNREVEEKQEEKLIEGKEETEMWRESKLSENLSGGTESSCGEE